jgi:hypothetical protein
MRCDICGDDMNEMIEPLAACSTKDKVRNIGLVKHPEEGDMVKRCRRCQRDVSGRTNSPPHKFNPTVSGGYRKIES